jgi:magnesium transporter
MARFSKTKKEEIGISPYDLVFRGDKKSNTVLLRITDFNDEYIHELEIENLTQAEKYLNTDSTTWLNVDGLHDEIVMDEISSRFDLQKSLISDVMNTHARPKFQEFDDCIYISLKMLDFNDEQNKISSENLVLIIKQNFLLTFQEKKGDVFNPVRERLRKNKKIIRISGSDYLAFALLDIVFDNYNYITGRIGDKIEMLEVKLLDDPPATIIEEIKNYKRELIFLKNTIKPCQELTLDLLKSESELLKESLYMHLEELKRNVNHAIESLESYREILSDHLSIYHSSISNKLNDIIKFLTIFSVIFIPLTFIAGVYGTNFDFLPEKHFKYSYFIMWGVMIIIALSMIYYFRRKKWL